MSAQSKSRTCTVKSHNRRLSPKPSVLENEKTRQLVEELGAIGHKFRRKARSRVMQAVR